MSRMRWVITVVGVWLLAGTSAWAQFPRDLDMVKNASFEQGIGDIAANWGFAPLMPTGADIRVKSWQNVRSRTGMYFCRIVSTQSQRGEPAPPAPRPPAPPAVPAGPPMSDDQAAYTDGEEPDYEVFSDTPALFFKQKPKAPEPASQPADETTPEAKAPAAEPPKPEPLPEAPSPRPTPAQVHVSGGAEIGGYTEGESVEEEKPEPEHRDSEDITPETDLLSAGVLGSIVPVTYGDEVRVRAWIRIRTKLMDTNRGAVVSIIGYTAKPRGADLEEAYEIAPEWGWTGHEVSGVTKTDGWKRLSIKIRVDDPSVAMVQVMLGMAGVGEVDYEDVRMTILPYEQDPLTEEDAAVRLNRQRRQTPRER